MSLNDFDFSFDLDAMNQDLNRVDSVPTQDNNNSNKYVRLPKGEGTVLLRILPADTRKGHRLPYASTRLHYINERSYHCLRDLEDGKWRGSCPACNYYNFLFEEAKNAKTKDEADALKEMGRNFKPIERYYYNCIVRKEVDSNGDVLLNQGPKILQIGKLLHGKILRAFLGNKKFDEAPLGNIAHPLTGRDLKLIKEIKKGEDAFPDYSASKFENESVLGDPAQIEKWLNAMYDLEAERTSNLKSYDELHRQIEIVQGLIEDDTKGFQSSSFTVPKELQGNKPTVPVQSRQVEKPRIETRVENSKPREEVPFNVLDDDDRALVEDDLFADIQRAVNNS